MSTEAQAAEKGRKVTARGIVIGIITVIFAVFCFMNLAPATVWPIGDTRVIIVILISFVLGALMGWLVRSVAATKAAQRRS